VDYKKALDIGRARAEVSAKALRRWTGVEAMVLCAVKVARWPERWMPVGEQSYKEIVRDNGFRGGGKYYLLVVDETGAVKACSKERFPLGEVLRLADRLPLRVAMRGEGELWKRLEEEGRRVDARERALCVEA